MNKLISRLRAFESDHEPEGYPAIKMGEVTALLDAYEAQEARLREIVEICAGMEGVRPRTTEESYLMHVVKQMCEAARVDS
jgi:hypothetical protein